MSGKETWPKVAIIVLNWNGWRDTIECLESLQRLTYPNYQIIVLDNGSTDDSVEKIKAWARGEIPVKSKFFEYDHATKPVRWVEYGEDISKLGKISATESSLHEMPCNRRLTVINVGRNLGFAGGNNIGIKYALAMSFEYIFILNNDAVVEENALTEMIKFALQNSKIGMVAPAVFNYLRPNIVDRLGIVVSKAGLGYDRKNGENGPLLCPSGCAALYSRSMFLALACNDEFFDEDFFAYCEDMDIGIRARLQGFRAVLAEQAIVFHKGGASFGGPSSDKSIYLRHRNTIWAIIKNYPVRILLKNILWIMLGQIGGLIKNLGRPQLQAVARGKIDGIKGFRKMWLKRKVCNKGIYGTIPFDKRSFLLNRRLRDR